ncbi:hypothetical protein ENBRE01_1877 [Enteropsectra breve]|nr:hypothetical protein ENBRE01_1877 [Enteropsectra breve]
MEVPVIQENILKHSLALNKIVGGSSFVLILYLSKFYYAELLKRMHTRICRQSEMKQGFIMGLFSALPFIIMSIACREEHAFERIKYSLVGAFITAASGFTASMVYYNSDMQINKLAGKWMGNLAIFSIATLLGGYVNRIFMYFTSLLLGLAFGWTVFKIFSKADTDVPPRQNLSDSEMSKILEVLRTIFYPLELFFDYSIIIYSGTKRPHLIGFANRTAVSCLINACILILYNGIEIRTRNFAIIAASALALAGILWCLAKKPSMFKIIALYSLLVCSGHFYMLFKLQKEVADAHGHFGKYNSFATTSSYLVPQVAIPSLFLNSFALDKNLKRTAVYGTLFSYFLQLLYTNIMSIVRFDPTTNFQFSVDSDSRIAFGINFAFMSIFLGYTNIFKGRYPKEFGYVCFYTAIIFYWGLFRIKIF